MQFEEWASKNLRDRYFSLIKRIRDEKLADKCTIPFVPYRGSAYGDDNKPKILVIGKATYGWGKGEKGQGGGALNAVLGRDDLWDHLSKLSEEFIEGQIIPFYGGEKGLYHSQFWNRIYRLTGQCLYGYSASKSEYKRERQRSEECFRSIAWSNVFKVGALKSEGGNPKKKLIDIQKEENKKEGNAFEEETTALQPDVAIFSTGPPDEYDTHIKDLLTNTSMEGVGPEHLKIKEIEGLDTLAFRTYHFQYYSNEKFEQVVDYICGRMKGQ